MPEHAPARVPQEPETGAPGRAASPPHVSLLAREPRDGITVPTVAARRGYRPNRFANACRKIYGRLPSQTPHS